MAVKIQIVCVAAVYVSSPSRVCTIATKRIISMVNPVMFQTEREKIALKGVVDHNVLQCALLQLI